jgi:hypothetical protein
VTTHFYFNGLGGFFHFGDTPGHDRANTFVQGSLLLRNQSATWSFGVDASVEEDFVGVRIADCAEC